MYFSFRHVSSHLWDLSIFITIKHREFKFEWFTIWCYCLWCAAIWKRYTFLIESLSKEVIRSRINAINTSMENSTVSTWYRFCGPQRGIWDSSLNSRKIKFFCSFKFYYLLRIQPFSFKEIFKKRLRSSNLLLFNRHETT